MAKANPNAPLGEGGRSAAIEQKAAKEGYSKKEQGALVGFIGRKKYGAKKMAQMSAAGRKGK